MKSTPQKAIQQPYEWKSGADDREKEIAVQLTMEPDVSKEATLLYLEIYWLIH